MCIPYDSTINAVSSGMVHGIELFSLSKKNATKAIKKINTYIVLLYILYIKFETDG